MSLTFSMSPSPSIAAGMFATFGLAIKSFREPLKKSVQDVMSKSIQKNFDDSGRPNKWAPLSEDRLRQKSALDQSADPLIATGKLRRVAGQLNVWSIDTDTAKISALPGAGYGFVHDEGYDPNNLPQRQFLAIQDGDVDNIEDIFANWITERAMKAGLFGSVF